MEIENKKTGEKRILNNASVFISRIFGNVFIDEENGICYYEAEWKKIEKPKTENIFIDELSADECNTLIKKFKKQ